MDRIERLKAEAAEIRAHGRSCGGSIERECIQEVDIIAIELEEALMKLKMYEAYSQLKARASNCEFVRAGNRNPIHDVAPKR